MKEYPMEYYDFFVKFNEGDYYTCHDLLEEMWLTDKENLFLKGLLQMTVALYHYSYGNIKGTRLMMSVASKYLQPYRSHYWDLHVDEVLDYIHNCLSIIPQHIDRVPYEKVIELPKIPKIYLYMTDDNRE